MITCNGQPGPRTKWKVKWNRYNEENHLSSPILSINAWEDCGLVVKEIKETNLKLDNPFLQLEKTALNIGCGKDVKNREDGFVWTNIDFRDLSDRVKKIDVFGKLPYEDKSFDYIYASDILEHCSFRHTDRVFEEWIRVLKLNGDIYIQVPCLTTILEKFQANKINEERMIELLYGGQNYPGGDWVYNVHYNCFSEERLRKMAERCGAKIKSIKKIGNNLGAVMTKRGE
jgi:predicted SAM-dependent methyltransferase